MLNVVISFAAKYGSSLEGILERHKLVRDASLAWKYACVDVCVHVCTCECVAFLRMRLSDERCDLDASYECSDLIFGITLTPEHYMSHSVGQHNR